MKKLHVKIDDQWLPVFCHNNGRILTCPDTPSKALPSAAMWAADDLAWFAKKFGNHSFCLMAPHQEVTA